MKMLQTVSILFAAVLILASQSFFVVDETESAIVLQFGKPVGSTYGPGLHGKLPFIQNAVFFDARVLEYDALAAEIITKDKKTMVVDNYSRWKIEDPLLFYQRVKTIRGGLVRISDIVYSQMREALGRYSMPEIVAAERSTIMEEVAHKSDLQLREYGIKVIDVRIKRADLPRENQQSIYERMQTEREREAKQYRSEGREAAVKITTDTDRQRAIMLADAQRESEELHGKGDAEATRIYAEALSSDPDFYAFTRSMDADKRGLGNKTRLILTPESEFFQYIK